MNQWYITNEDFCSSEIFSIKNNFSELSFKKENDNLIIVGELKFKASMSIDNNNVVIEDFYFIKLLFPYDYPESIPFAFETSGKIPKSYHTNPDGDLCLGVQHQLQKIFKENRTIIHFIKELLIPYLYRYSHIKKFGKASHPDLPHGKEGIIKYYSNLIGIQNSKSLMEMLKIIYYLRYRGHHSCPCDSDKKFRNCHGKVILPLITEDFNSVYQDLRIIFDEKYTHPPTKKAPILTSGQMSVNRSQIS